MKKQQVSMCLDSETRALVVEEAKRRHISVSAFMTSMIWAVLGNQEEEKKGPKINADFL